jgi:hypothetical protein
MSSWPWCAPAQIRSIGVRDDPHTPIIFWNRNARLRYASKHANPVSNETRTQAPEFFRAFCDLMTSWGGKAYGAHSLLMRGGVPSSDSIRRAPIGDAKLVPDVSMMANILNMRFS